MVGVDGACLQGAEQLTCRNKLIGIIEFDLQRAISRAVDTVDDRLCHMFAKRRPGIGLEPPFDCLLGVDRRCRQNAASSQG